MMTQRPSSSVKKDKKELVEEQANIYNKIKKKSNDVYYL